MFVLNTFQYLKYVGCAVISEFYWKSATFQ